MRAILLMFDSLNRRHLPPYNAETQAIAPNFARLAARSATFDRSYVGSMPCMPARRDLHTGRPHFLHTGWGPLEPFDDSVFAMLSEAGVYTHLATDHYHYFEDGGSTYHGRYDSWEFFRGQEGDPFFGMVEDPRVPDHINKKGRRQDWVNRTVIQRDEDYPQSRTVAAGVDFIDRNANSAKPWCLQMECFDPHEPFVTAEQWRDAYPTDYNGPLFDWPGYEAVTETPEQVDEARRRYFALLTKCDASLGQVLDAMDRHAMWDDTLLVVFTDHGFMFGEHGCWAKNWMPLYQEVAHTPLFIHDPRQPQSDGTHRDALVQPTVDLAPTLLNFFDGHGTQRLAPTPSMTGCDLEPAVAEDTPVHDTLLFGYHRNRVNLTDGRHVYLRDPVLEAQGSCFEYTLMPLAMRGSKLREGIELHPPFAFTRQTPVLKLGVASEPESREPQHLLFDVQADPSQEHPLADAGLQARLDTQMAQKMADLDAPPEQFSRMGLIAPTTMSS